MSRTRTISARKATLTFWLAGAVLSGVSCRDDDATNPTGPEAVASVGVALATTSTTAVTFRQVSAGVFHTCGVTTANHVYCWGSNEVGQLGDGTTDSRFIPAAVGGGLQFRVISAGGGHTCGITMDRRTFCWGSNYNGELGSGMPPGTHLTPVLVTGGLQFRQVVAGGAHTCGLTTLNRLYCWGLNSQGQLGNGSTTNRLRPVVVSGGYSFRQMSAGGTHTCGVTTSYHALCWGNNRLGRLGDGSTVLRRRTPVAVSGGRSFRQVSAGGLHTCALTTGNRAYCWGGDGKGQVGDGTTFLRFTPKAVAGGFTFSRLSAGDFHTCAETTVKKAYCWGWNIYGEIGDGTSTQRLRPTAVTGGLLFNQISTNVGAHTCGITPDGVAFCWGLNNLGQLGDDPTDPETCNNGSPCSTSPVRVADPS